MKKICIMLVLALVISLGSSVLAADKPENYPERNLEVMVGWGAGGGTDTFARSISIPASKKMDVPIVIHNITGSAGTLAANEVQNRPVDGYSLWACAANYAVNLAMGRTQFTPDKWEAVIRVQHDTGTLQTSDEGRFDSIQELIDFAKKHPGEVTIGGTGATSFDAIAVGLFASRADIEITYVPYEGSGSMQADVLSGDIDAMWEEIGSTIGQLKEGSLKPLIVFSENRVKDFPNVPTSIELGIDHTLGNWRGMLAKEGTPKEIVNYLHDTFKESMQAESYKKTARKRYLHLRDGYLSSKDFAEFIKQQTKLYKEVLADMQ